MHSFNFISCALWTLSKLTIANLNNFLQLSDDRMPWCFDDSYHRLQYLRIISLGIEFFIFSLTGIDLALLVGWSFASGIAPFINQFNWWYYFSSQLLELAGSDYPVAIVAAIVENQRDVVWHMAGSTIVNASRLLTQDWSLSPTVAPPPSSS